MARKSKYDARYHVPWIKGLAARGLTLEEMADDLEVATSTLQKWIKENEELSVALKSGRSFADTQVESSLYSRALGFKITEKKTIISSGGNTGEQKPVRIEIVEKDVPPDTTAAIFWLKNRRPDLWRDRQDLNLESDDWVEALTAVVGRYNKDDVAGTEKATD